MADYTREAIARRLEKLTGRSPEDANTLAEHMKVSTFLDRDGEIDETRLADFAATVGVAKPITPTSMFDPVRTAMQRGGQPTLGGDNGDDAPSVGAARNRARGARR